MPAISAPAISATSAMPLLAFSSKTTYYTVLTAVILVGVGYVIARVLADRKRRV